MKRLVCLLCAMVMLFSFATGVSASELDFLTKEYKSYDLTLDFCIEQNGDFAYFDVLTGEDNGEYDYKYFVNELLKAKFTADIKTQTSDDFLSGKMYAGIKSNVPLNFSEYLKISVDYVFKFWMEYDFTSEDSIKLNIIYTNPLSGKYEYVDLSQDFLKEVDGYDEAVSTFTEAFKAIDFDGTAKEYASIVKALCEGNAKVEKTDDGYILISFTDESLVNMIFDLYKDIMNTEYAKNVSEMEPEFDEAEFEATKALVKSLGIFADTDAFTLKVKLDGKGNIDQCEGRLHIQCNIFDIGVALGEDEDYMYPFTKENSDLDLTMVVNVKYNSVNENVVVEMPVLTEENSVNLLKDMYMYYEEMAEEEVDYSEYQPSEFMCYEYGNQVDGVLYVDAQTFIDNAQYDKDELTGSVEIDDEGNVVMIVSTKYMAPVKIEGNINADTYKINGVVVEGCAFAVIDISSYAGVKSAVGVSVDVLERVFDCRLLSVKITFSDFDGFEYEVPMYVMSLARPNMGYSEEE